MLNPVQKSNGNYYSQDEAKCVDHQPLIRAQDTLSSFSSEKEDVPVPVEVVRNGFDLFKEGVSSFWSFFWQKIETYEDDSCFGIDKKEEKEVKPTSFEKLLMERELHIFFNIVKLELSEDEIKTLFLLQSDEAIEKISSSKIKYDEVFTSLEKTLDISLEDRCALAISEAKMKIFPKAESSLFQKKEK